MLLCESECVCACMLLFFKCHLSSVVKLLVLGPIWRLERAQQTTIFRLCTGHCGLSAHLKRIGISDTSLCQCGQADQTPDHLFQSYPKYAKRRQLTWPQIADLATKLWDSAEDLLVLWHQPDLTCMAVDCWRRRSYIASAEGLGVRENSK